MYNFSKTATIRPFVAALFVIVIFGLVLSNFILPYSYKKFRTLQIYMQEAYLTKMIEERTFINAIHGITLYIETKNSDREFQGVFICDNRNPHHKTTIFAKEATLDTLQNGGIELFLNQGIQYDKSTNGSLSTLRFDKYVFNINTMQAKKFNEEDNRRYSIFTIIKNAHRGDRKYFYKNMSSAMQRIIWPVNALIAGIAAFSILINAKFHRKQTSIPALIGFVTAALYLLLSNMLASLASSNLVFFILYLAFTLLAAIAFFLNLYRPNYKYLLLFAKTSNKFTASV